MKNVRKYLKLFTTCLFLSSFTFGGGYVIISLMRKKFVCDLKWLEEQEMLDFTAIAQSSPGAIAVNASILLGYKIGGILGSLIAIIGTILPPIAIISVVSLFYNAFRENIVVNAVLNGMQAGIVAVICDVVITMASGIAKEKNPLYILIMAVAFALVFFVKVNIVYVILSCIIIGLTVSLIRHLQNRKSKPLAPDINNAGSNVKKDADEQVHDGERR